MAVRLLVARQRTTELFFAVHIDSTKTVDGGPDPAWVMRFRFPLPVPQEFTAAQYRTWVKDQMRETIVQELDRRKDDTAGTALPDEGTDL
jgi:hypothetical protein